MGNQTLQDTLNTKEQIVSEIEINLVGEMETQLINKLSIMKMKVTIIQIKFNSLTVNNKIKIHMISTIITITII